MPRAEGGALGLDPAPARVVVDLRGARLLVDAPAGGDEEPRQAGRVRDRVELRLALDAESANELEGVGQRVGPGRLHARPPHRVQLLLELAPLIRGRRRQVARHAREPARGGADLVRERLDAGERRARRGGGAGGAVASEAGLERVVARVEELRQVGGRVAGLAAREPPRLH